MHRSVPACRLQCQGGRPDIDLPTALGRRSRLLVWATMGNNRDERETSISFTRSRTSLALFPSANDRAECRSICTRPRTSLSAFSCPDGKADRPRSICPRARRPRRDDRRRCRISAFVERYGGAKSLKPHPRPQSTLVDLVHEFRRPSPLRDCHRGPHWGHDAPHRC